MIQFFLLDIILLFNHIKVLGNLKPSKKLISDLMKGHAKAQKNLGLMHARGKGVIKNNILAHMWWNISASKGNKDAAGDRGIVEKKMTGS
jgi:TPR repeat protein